MKKYIFILFIFGLMTGCDCTDPIDSTIHIYGTVQDKFTGNGISEVAISSDSLQIGDVVTGSDGNFSFYITVKVTKVKSKKINLIAQKPNYESDEQILDLNEIKNNPNKSIDYQLRHLAIVYKGVVTDASTGQPLKNTRMHAKIQNGSYIGAEGTVYTNDRGQYSLELHKPDYESWKYYVTADANGYEIQTRSFSHTQADIGKTINLDFQLIQKK